MERKLIFLLVSILLVFPGFSQSIDKAGLDAYFDTLANHHKFMGSVAVSQNGTLIYTKSVGYADMEEGIKANERSKYRIGSITKTFTAALVFMAVEENRLTLDQTIEPFFPAIVHAGAITIGQLLSHRSGIHNLTNDPSYLDWNTQAKTEQELVDLIVQGGSDFEPDTKASYSNSNFILLTFILEKTYGKPYAKLLEEKIIRPLGLKNTYFGGKINPENNECRSYKFLGGWKKEPETEMSVPLGAGSIVSTPVDLTVFAEALFNGKLISANSLKQMETIKDRFGMGLVGMPFYEKAGFGHTGGIDGFASLFIYFPEDRVCYAYTANGINYNGNDIAIAVLSAVYHKPFEIPSFVIYSLTDKDLDQYLGVYSSDQLPLKMTVTKERQTLIIQLTGQPAFPWEATGKDTFTFRQAGAVVEFDPGDGSLILKQGGGSFLFVKETLP